MMKTDETRQKIEEETKKREETGRRAGSRINGWMVDLGVQAIKIEIWIGWISIEKSLKPDDKYNFNLLYWNLW